MFLEPLTKVTVEDLLKGIIVQSGNDACIVIAEALNGSEEAFAAKMNDKASELGLKNSYFTNSTGWPEEKHLKEKMLHEFPEAIIPEELVSNFSNIETVIASTKYLKFALCNDSGVSHMLSTSYCPLIKLFGPKESLKFTPKNKMIHTISASKFNNNKIDSISSKYVIDIIDKVIQ